MKKIWKKVMCCCLSMALVLPLASVGTIVFAAGKMEYSNGVFTMEAENATIGGNFTVVSDAGLSGGKGVHTKNNIADQPAKTEEGDLAFSFTAKAAEKYGLWVSVNPTTANKSIWLSLGGSDYQNVKLGTKANEYSWVKLGEVSADKAGAEMKVKIKTRTGYFTMDQFTVSADALYAPQSVAPTATANPVSSAAPVVSSGKSVVFETKDGEAKFEAEKITVNGIFKETSDPAASGGKVLRNSAPNNAEHKATDPGEIEFSFKADKDGTYLVWVNVKPTTANKSVVVSVNQGEYANANLGGPASEYHWSQLAKVPDIKAGDTVSVRIRTRTGYFDLDNFIVSNMISAVPSGSAGEMAKGTVEFPQGTYPLPSITPPSEHPRVYFTTKDIPRILENAKKPQNAAAWEMYQQSLKTAVDGKLNPLANGKTTNCDSVVLTGIKSLAFDYVTAGNEASGKSAIAAMHNYINTVVYSSGDYNNTGETIFTIAVVYDWCYALLTDDDKGGFQVAVDQTAKKMEMGWPPKGQGAVTGHGVEGQLQRDFMSAAIAMYDERPDFYNFVAGRFFAEFVPAKKFMLTSHFYNQGDNYFGYRSQWEMLATLLMDTIGAPQVYGPDQQYLFYWMLYARRPDGQILRDGDNSKQNYAFGSGYYNSSTFRPMLEAANYFNDPYLKWGAMRQNLQFKLATPSANQSLDCIEFLIFNNPDLDAKPASELPLTKYFASPQGGMIARTGWNEGLDSPDMVAQMKINEIWFANHQHLDAGSFQIYYKGALANDTGYYKAAVANSSTANDGNTDYGSVHMRNYATRTIAHNSMLVFDPDEKFIRGATATELANDGGQKIGNISEASTIEQILDPANGYITGKVLGHEFGLDPLSPNYTYLKGDLAKAYSSKVENYERSFMFLNLKDKDHPGAMIVFDRVISSNDKFKKSWLLHGLNEPEVKGGQTVFKDTRPGYNGKLTVDTLLPKAENLAIEKIGGPDKEFWVNGTNYLALTKEGAINEGGGWRIEVSPKTPSKMDYFLNVLQVGDANPDMPSLPVETIETDKIAGVKIADRVVVFGKNRERTKEAVEFAFSGEGDFEITVADLEKGSWSISKDGSPIATASATEEGGMAVFNGAAGSYKLTYVNDAVNRPVIQPEKTQREDIGLRVDNQFIYTDVPPTMRDDRTLVPMRAIFEKLGVTVVWDDATATATATRNGREVKITEGSNIAYVDGKEVKLDVPANVINGRFLVPVRFVSEAFDATVEWYELSKVVNITSKK